MGQLAPFGEGSKASTTSRDYLQLVNGYDTFEDTHYPKMDLDDWLANQIWWVIDTTSNPGLPAEFGSINDSTNPLTWALFGKQLLTTAIDTGYGGPHYIPLENIKLVAAALQELKSEQITMREEELVQLGHINSQNLPLIHEGLETLSKFYTQALQSGQGVIVTAQ